MELEELIIPRNCPESDKRENLLTSIRNFINNESAMNAENVYTLYMDLYRSLDDEDGSPLLDMIDVMKHYEIKASVFTENQRDHYIHSVNVFLLGLRIYLSNEKVRRAFWDAYGNNGFASEDELFLFIWGHASLFHDIGYPIEISHNQAKSFINSLSGLCPDNPQMKIVLGFDPIGGLLKVDGEDGPYNSIIDVQIEGSGTIGLSRHGETEECIRNYPLTMFENRFSDHGFFSSLIVARCYSMVSRKNSRVKGIYVEHIPSVCSAILMHNLYPQSLVKRNGFPPLTLEESPLTYLLILCDELQEWNRKGYGFGNANRIHPKTSDMVIDDRRLRLNYCFNEGEISQKSSEEKTDKLYRYLDIREAFPEGLQITCSLSDIADKLLSDLDKNAKTNVPRLLSEQILQIAKEIHDDYNRHRMEENPGGELEYPEWDSLTQDLKYSNMDQALDMPRKLDAIGCHIEKGEGGLSKFNDDERLILSIMEHERWMNEKISNGWVYGKEKDVAHRISPYLVPWDDLPQDIQERDTEAIDNMIPILKGLGFKVVRNAGETSE
jgi:hypothetical protein